MKNKIFVKGLVLAVVVLFICVTVTPSIGISRYLDDTTPPVTTISFNPPGPDGQNGWYVHSVTVTLNATDDDSGINITYYSIDIEDQQIYTEPFILSKDGVHLLQYFSIDIAGNKEEKKSVEMNIDRTKPRIGLDCEWADGNPMDSSDILFTADASDGTSGMNRVEFYFNGHFWTVVYGSGPTYQWILHYPAVYNLKVRGLIRNPEVSDEYVKFYAVVVITKEEISYLPQATFKAIGYDNAGNTEFNICDLPEPPLFPLLGGYLFRNVTLPFDDYHGYIGKFFIRATFDWNNNRY